MTSFFVFLYVLFSKYIVPLIFAAGLVYLIYGLINYFIIGEHSHDEGRLTLGRELLIKSCSLFTIALGMYAIIAFLGWAGSVITQGGPSVDSEGDAGARIERSNAVLGVPNVPRENDE